jgi:hypothetical protein
MVHERSYERFKKIPHSSNYLWLELKRNEMQIGKKDIEFFFHEYDEKKI